MNFSFKYSLCVELYIPTGHVAILVDVAVQCVVSPYGLGTLWYRTKIWTAVYLITYSSSESTSAQTSSFSNGIRHVNCCSSQTQKMYLEPSLLVVFSDAVILAGSTIEAVADAQYRGEQGTGELVTDFDCQLDRLCGEGRPCQEAITWSGEHKSHITVLQSLHNMN